MAGSTEQSVRVTARGEFGQLQRGLKDLQGDLRNVLGEIDKGARRGGFFDDSQLRALDLYRKRFKDAMGDLDREFKKQNDAIDRLHEKMSKASSLDKKDIEDQIKAREKELDVIRKQYFEVEKLYKKRLDEAKDYELKPGGSSNKDTGGSFVNTALGKATGVFNKALGAASTVAKFAAGLAGIGSIMSLGQQAYQLAYQRQVGSLDLGQRIRGYGFHGTSAGMYDQVSAIGRQDNMGYTQPESWALQEAYTSRAGALGAEGQYGLQKFSRGYGLDATEVGGVIGGVKQLGGVTQPKNFADMIASSVSQSGMLPRIMEVMQTHTGLLQNLNTSFKDGASQQILAYQTTLDRLGNENGMTRLTGQQGANVIGGMAGIFSPNNDKWKWTGVAALQHYNPEKYGSMGLYDLEGSFEQGIENPDNIPAMAGYLKEQAGGNNQVFKRLMQSWLQEGGFNATKSQVTELDQVTNGFTAFEPDKIANVLGTDSGAKYTEERQNETGQGILSTEANFQQQLTAFGDKYILPEVQSMKADFTSILEAINEDKGIKKITDNILKFLHDSGLDKLLLVLGASQLLPPIIKGGGKLGGKLFKGKTPTKAKGKMGDLDEFGEKATPKDTEATPSKRNKNGTSTTEVEAPGQRKVTRELTGGEKEVLDEASGGDPTKRKALEDDFRSHGNLDKTMSNADELAKGAGAEAGATGGLLSKLGKTKAGGLLKGAGEALGKTKVGGTLTKVGGGLLERIPLVGGLMDFGINKLSGEGTGRSIARAIGSTLGGLGGGAIGALFGGAGAVPGAIGGGIGGDMAGAKVYDFFAGSPEAQESAKKLQEFADSGELALDGLSTYGKAQLEQLQRDGLLKFVDMGTSSTTTLKSMSDEGKAALIDLQKNGEVSIGGLQADGSAKITALNDEGKKALDDLNKSGQISITDFQKTGKVKITELSDTGAKELVSLQKNGSATLEGMSSNSEDEMKTIREANVSTMDDIGKEHKGIGSIFKKFGAWIDVISSPGGFSAWVKGTTWYDESKQAYVVKGGQTFAEANEGDSLEGALGAVTASRDVRKLSGVSAGALNAKLRGKLSGHGQDFVNAGEQYGIDPAFLAAISMQETGNGSVVSGNNVGGMMGSHGLMSFGSLDEGISAMAENLKNLYIDQGLTTPEEIQKRYAPLGASNDPTGLNNNWLSGVLQFYKGFNGVNDGSEGGIFGSLMALLGLGGGSTAAGGGFFKNWQNKVTSNFGSWRGDHGHGGLDIDGETGDTLNALASGKIEFLRMDDGGRYDADGTKNTRMGGTEIGIRMADGNLYSYSHMSNVNQDMLSRYMRGEDVEVSSGDYLGNVGGDPGVAGSGYSTTGSHLHLGYQDASGNLLDPRNFLDGLNSGDSDMGINNTAKPSEAHIVVDVNLKGEGADKLNSMTTAALKQLISQVVTEIERQKLAMNPITVG